MKSLLHALLARSAMGLVVGSLGCSCPKVQLPASDSTKPWVEWVVRNKETDEVHYYTNDATHQAKLGEKYAITMTALDMEGVHTALLETEDAYGCDSLGGGGENVGTRVGPGLKPKPEPLVKDQWPSGLVCTEIEQVIEWDLVYPCEAGSTFGGATVTLKGTATNFFGGTGTASLVLHVTP